MTGTMRLIEQRAPIQRFQGVDTKALPVYSRELLLDETSLYPEWFLKQYLGLPLNSDFWDEWSLLNDSLLNSASEQPQMFVHRDFLKKFNDAG